MILSSMASYSSWICSKASFNARAMVSASISPHDEVYHAVLGDFEFLFGKGGVGLLKFALHPLRVHEHLLHLVHVMFPPILAD